MINMEEEKHKNALIAQQYRMRFYQNQFPVEGQLVQGQSQKSEENGCYVALLEYNNKIGMMPINQYTTTMRKAIHRAMKVGKKQILRVIRVDKQKGYIDLSKKQVNVEDENQGEEKYANSTQLHSILIHIAQACKVPILHLYQNYIWPIYRQSSQVHPLTVLKYAMTSEQKLNELNITDPNIKNSLLEELKRRFKKPVIKTMSNFSVSCRSFEGISAIKKTLAAGIQASKDKGYQVKIFIIGAPKYTCEVSSVTVQAGKDALNTTLDAIKNTAQAFRGDFVVDKQPYVVGDTSQHIKDMIKDEQVQEVLDVDDEDMGDADD